MNRNPPAQGPEPAERLPLSLLNDFLYCPRRAALKLVEGWREANAHTERGDSIHEHADLPGYELVEGVKLLRALPVWSARLGLNGKCDLVEVRGPASELETLTRERHPGAGVELLPVEFKVGPRRPWVNDDAQLCAQGLCLEEMFGLPVPRGAVFHAESKRRREVAFSAPLRETVGAAAAALHRMADPERPVPLPAAVYQPACTACSLYKICLPQATSAPARLARVAAALYET